MSISRRSFIGTGMALSGTSAVAITPTLFGGKGDGRADDTQALTKALRAAVSGGGVVRLEAGKTYVASDLHVPRNSLLVFEPGSRLRPSHPGATLTLDGNIASFSLDRIFEDNWLFAKTGSELLDGFQDVPIEWFGGRASWVEKKDSLAAFRYAIAFCSATRARAILLSNGCYFVSDTIRIDCPVGIKGVGRQSTYICLKVGSSSAATIELVGPTNRAIKNLDFADFSIMPVEAGQGVGIRARWFADIRLTGVEIRNCGVGIEFGEAAYSWRIANCQFLDNHTHLVLGEASNNTMVSRCQFLHGATGIACTGSSNSITIGDQTNFELISGRPITWGGVDTQLLRFSVTDSRFEKCTGAIGRYGDNARISSFAFERCYVENRNGTTACFFELEDCDNVQITGNYFERANSGLLRADPSAVQLRVSDNLLLRVPKINAATVNGDFPPKAGYIRCRAYNCGTVRGSENT